MRFSVFSVCSVEKTSIVLRNVLTIVNNCNETGQRSSMEDFCSVTSAFKCSYCTLPAYLMSCELPQMISCNTEHPKWPRLPYIFTAFGLFICTFFLLIARMAFVVPVKSTYRCFHGSEVKVIQLSV